MQGFVYLDNLISMCCKETVGSWGAISRKDQKDIYKVLKIGSSSLLTGGPGLMIKTERQRRATQKKDRAHTIQNSGSR